jgi:hypothetical protein
MSEGATFLMFGISKRLRFVRRLTIFVVIIVVAAIALWMLLDEDYKTVTVNECIHSISYDAVGLVIRDEVVVAPPETNQPGLSIEYIKQSGERVRINDLLMSAYASSSVAKDANKLADLNNQLAQLSSLVLTDGNAHGASAGLCGGGADSLLQMVKNLKDMKLVDAKRDAMGLLMVVNQKRLITGREKDFFKGIAELNLQIKNLEGRRSGLISQHFAPASGCFFRTVDGYESLSAKDVLLTPSEDVLQLERLFFNVQKKKESKRIFLGAKIVTGYDWCLLVSIDSIAAKNIEKQRHKITFDFGFPGGQEIPAQLVSAVESRIPDKSFLVFKANYMNERIAKLRVARVNICIGKLRGIKCPAAAIRFLNGEKGVFVKEGKVVRFKKLAALYEDENVVLSKASSSQHGFLSCWDEVVVHSKGLFAEKVL